MTDSDRKRRPLTTGTEDSSAGIVVLGKVSNNHVPVPPFFEVY